MTRAVMSTHHSICVKPDNIAYILTWYGRHMHRQQHVSTFLEAMQAKSAQARPLEHQEGCWMQWYRLQQPVAL